MRKIHQRVERAQSCLPASSYTAKWVMIPFFLFRITIWKSETECSTKVSFFVHLKRYEKRYGPDSFVSHLVAPLKSTTYNGLESWNPHKYIGMPFHFFFLSVVCSVAFQNRTDERIKEKLEFISFQSTHFATYNITLHSIKRGIYCIWSCRKIIA